ncbi:MAG: hypothetical protein H6823_16485 [Planctomycetaceae bacterium]|nr:hypothetical protein [Planctomycetales bacterium]MCB9939837.1 hypothetical protein [Planctomycetaceae bacterium]
MMKNDLPPPSVTQQAIPGGWSERELSLGNRSVRILLPAEPDEFLDELEKTAVDAPTSDPYWAELWPASLPMAQLITAAKFPTGTHAIEIGCGVGVVGLAGLIAGLDVTFTDHVELAIHTALENAYRNGFPTATGYVLDWTQPPTDQYPVILASDVLYDRELHEPLLRTIESLLSTGGECWIGDPGRSATESFLELVTRSEFRLRLLDESGKEVNGLRLGTFRLMILQKG